MGQCALACDEWSGDCDSDLTTGCEASLSDDLSNCGKCNDGCYYGSGVPGGNSNWYHGARMPVR